MLSRLWLSCLTQLQNPGPQQVGMFCVLGGCLWCHVETTASGSCQVRFEIRLLIYSGTLSPKPRHSTCKLSPPPVPHITTSWRFELLMPGSSLQFKSSLEFSGSSEGFLLLPFLLHPWRTVDILFFSRKFFCNWLLSSFWECHEQPLPCGITF